MNPTESVEPRCQCCGQPILHNGHDGPKARARRKFCSHRCSAKGQGAAARAGRMSVMAAHVPAPIRLPRLKFLEHRFDWERE